ncbi:MAG: type II toxin-antitoxin system PrlF family antitoxin [Rhodocyclaceae bacterium]|nr:type II toxin-antitoxin system PrlF family antitoxin [Rhodocyclaceae bacterium]
MPILEAVSTLTARYQTTIPDSVRKVLGLHKHDRVLYRVAENGAVYLVKAEVEMQEDPALSPFLALLDARMQNRPETLSPYTEADAAEDLELVKGVAID